MTAVLSLDQVAASLSPAECRHPDDLLRIEYYGYRCFSFRCGVCGTKVRPSKRCPSCAVPLKSSPLGPGMQLLFCSECHRETIEVSA